MKCLSVIIIACVLLGAECASKKKDKPLIISGEEDNSSGKCARVCSGSSGRGTTAWKKYGNSGKAAYVDVDISG